MAIVSTNGMSAARLRAHAGWAAMGMALCAFLVAAPAAHGAASSVPTTTWAPNDRVNTMITSGPTTYIGGDFSQIGPATGPFVGVDATSATNAGWPEVRGDTHNAVVEAVASDGSGGWYIGGLFNSVGGVPRRNLAHLLANKTVDPAWSADTDDHVFALTLLGSTLYVGGKFMHVGGDARSRIAAVAVATGAVTTWNPGADQQVQTLTSSGTTIYAGGYFTHLGGDSRAGVGAVSTAGTTTAWNPSSAAVVFAITISGPDLYIGGSFSSMGGQTRTNLAAVGLADGVATSWNASADSLVFTLAASGSTVYAGGLFDNAGGAVRKGLAAFGPTGAVTAWNPNLGSLYNAGGEVDVLSLAIAGSTVYAAGAFASAGGLDRPNLVALDATTAAPTAWTPRPGGQVSAIGASASTVFAGGYFESVGGVRRRGLAAIDSSGMPTSWDPDVTNDSIRGSIYEMALSGSTLYVAGGFDAVHGTNRQGLAAVDLSDGVPTAWAPDPDDAVDTLATSGSTVYAGGEFTHIGGQAREHIAALDASTGAATAWNPGTSGYPRVIAPASSSVFVGGSFDEIGGRDRNNLAELSASTGAATTWNPNVEGAVDTLALSGTTLYAGGNFNTVGGLNRSHLVALDTTSGTPTAWSPAVSNDDVLNVSALAISGSTVYVGGYFDSIAGQTRHNLAAVRTSDGSAMPWNPALDLPYGFSDVRAIALGGTSVYAGGDFDFVGAALQPGFARFDDDGVVPPPHALTVSTAGSGSGSVTSTPGTINCPGTCAGSFADGQLVTLTATPATGSSFAGWSGACSATATCSITMDDARAATATFSVITGTPIITPLPPPLPPPITDTTAPSATLTGRTQKLGRTVVIKIACTAEACTAKSTASVRVPAVGSSKAKTYKLKASTTTIAKGKNVTVKLSLPAAARSAIKRALRAHKRVVVAVKVTVSDAAHNTRLLTRQVRLKR